MQSFGFSKLKFVNPNVKALMTPIVALVVLVFLSLFLIQNGYSWISSQLDQLKSAKKNEAVLEEKAMVLREVKGLLPLTDKVVIALPYKNPGLWMLSQLKSDAATNSITLTEISLANEAKFEEDLTKMDLSLEVTASDSASLVSFLRGVESLAPVSTINSATIKSNIDKTNSAEVKLSIYWSELPTVLPSITAPVNDLTLSEKELLDKVSSLTPPQFTSFSPSEPVVRENPFD